MEKRVVYYNQNFIPKQLVNEFFRSLQGKFGKHPEIAKTKKAYREIYCLPKTAQLIREWFMSCEHCIRESRIDRWLNRPHLQNPNEHIIAPEDAMQIDLVTELLPSGGYESFVTAIDVFFCFLFAYPTSNQDAKITAIVISNIMTKHAYLPTTLISDKGSAFMSHVIKEAAGVLCITPKHATKMHSQRFGPLERSYTSIKQALIIETSERRSLWHKYVSIEALNYNNSYHTSIGCQPSRVFHAHIPHNIPDINIEIRPQQAPVPTSRKTQDVFDRIQMIFQDVPKNAMQDYIKYIA